MDCVIELKNVTYSYPLTTVPAIKDLSVKIEKGKFYGVIGENGSGKTTFCALLRGFAELIAEETGMPVSVAANPLDCVVLGTAKRLETNSGFDNYVFRRGKRFR